MTKRVVLIGHPVAHSLSGAMQQAAFDAQGIDARYELWDRAPIALADAIAEVRGDGFLGANVTIPHKERVVPMIDKLTEEAQATGAVNTITREGRRLVGHNTDVPGFKVALDGLVGRQKMPRAAIVLGANITIPHKERVVPMVDRLTEEASATGAVNTLTREGMRLIGHNTDVAGFKVALDRLVGRQKMPRQAVLLGAGGGGRAVVYGLIREGFQRIVVFNRHLHRAEGLVKHFGRQAAHMELRAMPWHESIIESELAKTKVLINATSIGLTSDASPVPAEALHDDLLVLDLIYSRTRLIRDAEAAGATVADGELMLLHQGAAAFTLWTGQPAPLDLMQERLAAARAGGLRSAEGEPAGAEPAGAGAAASGPAETGTNGTAVKETNGTGRSEPAGEAATTAAGD